MIMPDQMDRILIVGSKDSMKKTIDVLYESETIHLIDFPAEEKGFSLGQPLPESSAASLKLLKLRALEKDLELAEGEAPKKTISVIKVKSDHDSSITQLDGELASVVDSRAKAQTKLVELQNELKILEPFLNIDVPLELYRGYSSINVTTGFVRSDPTGPMKQASTDSDVLVAKGGKFIVAFYPKKDASEVQKVLAQCGFTEVPIPMGSGMPTERVKRIEVESVELEKVIDESSKKLEELREKFGDFINAADEQLSIEVQVAETPLRFGTTPHSFVVDGWVPHDKTEVMQKLLKEKVGETVFMDVLETASRTESHAHDTQHIEHVDYGSKEEIPTKQSNGKTVKKFEFLTEMISTPKYKEIDPTIVLAITFPLFFGLMIGDVGYGVAFLSLGALGLSKCKSPEWRTIATMLFFGGLWATLFGMFLFGEALGMHFNPVWTEGATSAEYPFGNEITWSWLLNYNLPHIGIFSKLVDVKMLLFISMMIGFAHLAIGFGLGFYNKSVRYGLKHAIMEKFSWLMILAGGWFLLIWLIDVLIQPIAWMGFPLLSYYVFIGMGLIIPGTIMALIGEGGGALLELPGMMSNILSYTRLTAIGMSKAGLALAFNTLAFSIIGFSGINVVFAIMVFVVGQLMVFILGIISAGMHSIRLHYVELFQKFYEGGGLKFNPLRIVRKWTSEITGE